MLDIARDKKNIEKRERKTKNEKKPKQQQRIFFLLLLFYTEKYAFCQKTCFKKLNLYYYIYVTVFCVAGSRKCSNKTPIPI